MPHLALHLLGPPRIERDGEPVRIRRRKALALLAYLAVADQGSGGKIYSRDALATLFWPECDQSRARAGLRRTLASLKKALGEGWLDADRETVGLSLYAHPLTSDSRSPSERELWLDVREFQDRVDRCRKHGHALGQICSVCLSLLGEAAALYCDDFLSGFTLRDSPAFDEWQFFQTQGLRNALAYVLEQLARSHKARGALEQAIVYARRWVALDELHEPAQRRLMELYARSGQRAAALRQYEECQHVLQEELDVVPQEETDQLYQAIREGRDWPGRADRGAATVLSRPEEPAATRVHTHEQAPVVHNLPVHLTPFVGREAVLSEIRERLRDPACRLLTLLGPGGSGKTRLALETAERELPRYTHGVCFVSLAPLDSVEAIVPSVAEALGLTLHAASAGSATAEPLGFTQYATSAGSAPAEPQQQLLDYLHRRAMLLIMDNYEHLLEGTELLVEILRTAPKIEILATSRVRLNIGGEHRFHVGGMNFPASASADARQADRASQFDALKLFLQGACRAQPGFAVTAENLRGVLDVCSLVEGMPLGIRLAAAVVDALTPAEIAAEIGKNLDFLQTDRSDVPERQRSMRATFDYSWNLLTRRQRAVLQALSVFRGGFTREAAQQVAGASLRDLMSLFHKSFVHRTSTGRYELHELLRQFVARELDESPGASRQARARHSAYFVAALQQWGAGLKGPRQQDTLLEMDVELENARTALDWAAEQGQVEWIDQGIEGLCLFCIRRGRYRDGLAICRLVTDKLVATASGSGPALPVQAVPTPMQDPGARAMQGLRRHGSDVEALRVGAKVLAWQGVFCKLTGRIELAAQLLDRSLLHVERPELAAYDTRADQAFILLERGRIALYSDRARGERLGKQSLALYDALGDRWGMANALDHLAAVAMRQCKYGEVERQQEQCLAIRRQLGDRAGIASSLSWLAAIGWRQGRFVEAEGWKQEAITILREMGNQVDVAVYLLDSGMIQMGLGKYAVARMMMTESLSVFEDFGVWRGVVPIAHVVLAFAEMGLGSHHRARTQAETGLGLAREIGIKRPIGLAFWALGCEALARESFAEAQGYLEESRTLFVQLGQPDAGGWVLAGLAAADRGVGQFSRARQHVLEALQVAVEIQALVVLLNALPVAALLLADRGERERAVELYALASCLPWVANSQWFEDVVGKHIAAVAAALPPEEVTAAESRGRACDMWETAAELLAELGG